MEFEALTELVKNGASALDAVVKAVKGTKEMLQKPEPRSGVDTKSIDDSLSNALDQLLTAKKMQLDLMDALLLLKMERAALDQQRMEIEQFRSKSAHLVLREVSDHSFAYVDETDIAGGQRLRYFCAHCYDKPRLSLMQFKQRDFRFDTLECHECRNTIRVPNNVEATVMTAKVKKGWDFF